ncbi:MAG: DUF1801 domain-containing protein [Acidimicrobiales bacterium]|nr:DUF1801 domain-containing protein [Acidimicrobiales bacterium]
MASSSAATVDQYLAELPEDRRALIGAIRDVVNANLPDGYQEAMQYGMIGWSVPHDLYPAGYHTDPSQPLPLAALASQKQYVSLYLMGTYCGCAERSAAGAPVETDEMAWFRQAWLATGRTLNMGSSCVRVKKLDEVALDVVAEAIRRLPVAEYVARYDAIRPAAKRSRKR